MHHGAPEIRYTKLNSKPAITYKLKWPSAIFESVHVCIIDTAECTSCLQIFTGIFPWPNKLAWCKLKFQVSSGHQNTCAAYQNITNVTNKCKRKQPISHCSYVLSKEVMCQLLFTTLTAQNICMCKHLLLFQNNRSTWILSVVSPAGEICQLKSEQEHVQVRMDCQKLLQWQQWIPSVNWWNDKHIHILSSSRVKRWTPTPVVPKIQWAHQGC